MTFVVSDAVQAREAVDHFNAFHDGFIRSLRLVSHDWFEDRHTHVTTGRIDLEILFAHSNYGAGVPPHDQVIEARFDEVRDMQAHFTGLQVEWPIATFEIEPAPAPEATGGSGLRACLTQPRLVDGRWEIATALTFGFSRAVFRELAPGAVADSKG